MHAVTGIWVSVFALLLILSGLPWADSWGGYLREMRTLTGTEAAMQDWSKGSRAEADERARLDAGARAMLNGHAEHGGMTMHHAGPLSSLDRVVPAASALSLAAPVEISPPTDGGHAWLVKSNAANRPDRATVEIDGRSGELVGRENFDQRHWIDRVVGYGIALHEGAFFGLANQLFNLAVLIGLVTLALSGVVLWWRRRPEGVLGAPTAPRPVRHSWLLVLSVIALALLVPLFGISLALVILAERLWLRRNSRIVGWLGLRPPG